MGIEEVQVLLGLDDDEKERRLWWRHDHKEANPPPTRSPQGGAMQALFTCMHSHSADLRDASCLVLAFGASCNLRIARGSPRSNVLASPSSSTWTTPFASPRFSRHHCSQSMPLRLEIPFSAGALGAHRSCLRCLAALKTACRLTTHLRRLQAEHHITMHTTTTTPHTRQPWDHCAATTKGASHITSCRLGRDALVLARFVSLRRLPDSWVPCLPLPWKRTFVPHHYHCTLLLPATMTRRGSRRQRQAFCAARRSGIGRVCGAFVP